MLKSLLRSSAAFICLFLWTATVSAQQDGQAGGDTGTGGTNAGGTDTGTGTGGIGATLDAETAFSAIDRGDTVGSTASTGQGFSDASAATGGGGAGGGLGGFGGGGFGGLGGLGNLFGNFNTGAGQSTKPAIRTRMRSAINVQLTPPARVQQIATQRFRSLATRPQLRGIQVNMQGKTAVISGVVSSERDRRMSQLLMQLEPGVQRVDNQVVVLPQ
jgi:hypothetical protein